MVRARLIGHSVVGNCGTVPSLPKQLCELPYIRNCFQAAGQIFVDPQRISQPRLLPYLITMRIENSSVKATMTTVGVAKS
jgi:hypothetical protein